MNSQDTIDFHIKSTWHGMFKMYNQVAAKYGTTQATGLVLLSIHKLGTPSTSIAPSLGMQATSLSRIMKNLEDKKLIFRKQDDKDKRMVRIFLTPEGVEKRKIAKKVVEGFNDLILEEIPQSKLTIFFEVMESINKTIEKYKKEN
ncbi:MAG: MarR family transcriptional regulator [Flavobacteriales bacterium CG_4_10_14_0_2_um_filter_32_8]|nr:MAG: MarR family transcriptional regulator [Flavobacteriales bacterium CG_4_10_14_0_2_um_filter_32_8]PJB14926.1 MAG: MarR family transcriptional regulator [Flavobacteriales bacterium CG_4_9_14_3_um_filter_32_8]